MARGVYAIDADILQWPAPMFGLQAVIAGGHLEAEYRLENQRRADAALPDMIQNGQGGGFVVQPVCGHQENSRGIGGGNHGLGFGHGYRQRFFHHDVLARPCGANGIVGVHGIRQCDIDCIHRVAGQQRVVIGIGHHFRDAVKGRQLVAFFQIARHNCGNGGIARLRHAGQKRLLADPARADDGISDHLALQFFRRKAQDAAGKSAQCGPPRPARPQFVRQWR